MTQVLVKTTVLVQTKAITSHVNVLMVLKAKLVKVRLKLEICVVICTKTLGCVLVIFLTGNDYDNLNIR